MDGERRCYFCIVNADTTTQTFGSIVDLRRLSAHLNLPSLVEIVQNAAAVVGNSVVTKAAKYAFNLSSSDENICAESIQNRHGVELQFVVPLETGDHVNVQISLKISEPGNIELIPTILVENSPNVGVWDWKINIGCVILSEEEATLFEMQGLALFIYLSPFSGNYLKMAHMASYGPFPLDNSISSVRWRSRPQSVFKRAGCQVSSSGKYANFGTQAIVPNAGEGGMNYEQTWPIVVLQK